VAWSRKPQKTIAYDVTRASSAPLSLLELDYPASPVRCHNWLAVIGASGSSPALVNVVFYWLPELIKIET